MLLSLLGTALSGIFAGGATGLLGVALQRLFDWLHVKAQMAQQKQQNDFELEKRRIDIQVTQAEWAGRVKVADTEASAAKDVAESNAFAASLLKEPERYATGDRPQGWLGNAGWFLLVLTDVFRGFIRPALTVYLCALTTYVWWQVRQLLSIEDLDAGEVLEVWRMVVGTILYLTTTCILWWFGTRNKGPQPVLK